MRLRRAQSGGVVVGERKIWLLTYADDTVLVAWDEEGMKGMIKTYEKYIRPKKLEVNVTKTIIMVFSKGSGKGRRKERK